MCAVGRGSLALVLILAVVYAALGKGDRRTARTTQERKSAVDNIEAIADHIAGVFATDVFNVVPEITDSNVLGDIYNTNTPIMRREAVDMPVTDWGADGTTLALACGAPPLTVTGDANTDTIVVDGVQLTRQRDA